jgi:hypothetical protein
MSIFENLAWTFVKKAVVSIMQRNRKKREKKPLHKFSIFLGDFCVIHFPWDFG